MPFAPLTGAARSKKSGKRTSMRPDSASSRSRMRRATETTESALIWRESSWMSCTKRLMCVPFDSAGTETESSSDAIVGRSTPFGSIAVAG